MTPRGILNAASDWPDWRCPRSIVEHPRMNPRIKASGRRFPASSHSNFDKDRLSARDPKLPGIGRTFADIIGDSVAFNSTALLSLAAGGGTERERYLPKSASRRRDWMWHRGLPGPGCCLNDKYFVVKLLSRGMNVSICAGLIQSVSRASAKTRLHARPPDKRSRSPV